MRPSAEDISKTRSRHSSFTDNSLTPLAPPGPPQMSFFLADEKSLGGSRSTSRKSSPTQSRLQLKRNNYGVESLESTISLASQDSDEHDEHDESLGMAREAWKKSIMRGTSQEEDGGLSSSRSPSAKTPAAVRSDASHNTPSTTSRPTTPYTLESPMLGSTPGSPISRRGSETDFLTDDAASQVIMSSDEDQDASEAVDSSAASQLVMPSISMPRRRPFTDKGKAMGRLKILVAGDSGVGKSSLIRAVVQTCEDIVHADSLFLPSTSAVPRDSKSRSKSRKGMVHDSTTRITEVYASTRAYPSWWSELEEGKVLRRRRSSGVGDSILERNICFVDTPGWGKATSCLETITPVTHYIESQIERCLSIASLSDSEFISMMGGNGGSQVDLVLYVVKNNIRPVDLEYMQRLAPLTNIIPVLSHADTLSSEEIETAKRAIRDQFQTANIKAFSFIQSLDLSIGPTIPELPYAVSTIAGNDHETMDASLLMSPDYVKPLVASELAVLVSRLFNPENMSWLRHSAARKCANYRSGSVSPAQSQSISQSISPQSNLSLLPASQILTGPLGATNSYAVARITDHTQREERLAQVRLSKWAADLQRSLQNERLQFEALARGERAIWLTERLNECVQDGTLVPLSSARPINGESPLSSSGPMVKTGAYSRKRGSNQSRNTMGMMHGNQDDPLGIVQLNEEMKRRMWSAFQIVGSFGVVGGLAIWLSRGWGVGMENGERWEFGADWGRLLSDW